MVEDKINLENIAAVEKAIGGIFPIETPNYKLTVDGMDPKIPDIKDYSFQKKLKLEGKSLVIPIYSKMTLEDKSTGKRQTNKFLLLNVPAMTPRGTYLVNGVEYQIVKQFKLKPGAFVYRPKFVEDPEAFFNFARKGKNFRIVNREGVLAFKVNGSHIPVYPYLKESGYTDSQIAKAWGNDVLQQNKTTKMSPARKEKLYSYLGQENIFDPNITKVTLGQSYDRLNNEAILRASQKLVNVLKGTEQPDRRDALYFKEALKTSDLLHDRLKFSKPKIVKRISGRMEKYKELPQAVDFTMFAKPIYQLMIHSKLSEVPSEVNPIIREDSFSKITPMGEGGIEDLHAMSLHTRNIDPSYLGFVDPIHTPEGCFGNDMSVFTKKGWILWPDVNKGTKFACNIDGQLEFHRAKEHQVYDFEGELYGAKSQTLEYLVTPGHRLWTRPNDQRRDQWKGCEVWRHVLAPEVHNKNRQFLCGGPIYKGIDKKYFELPKIDKKSNNTKTFKPFVLEDFAEFLGWYLSEGCSAYNEKRNDYRISITQSKKANPNNCKKIESLLGRLGFNWCFVNKKHYIISGKQFANYLKQFGDCYHKFIPEEAFDWPISAREKLLNSLIFGDGKIDKRWGNKSYFTTSKRLAEDVQRLCFSLGISSGITKPKRKKREDGSFYAQGYTVHLHKCNVRVINNQLKSKNSGYYREKYKGKVYCASVPGELLYVRRNNKCGHWSGNSRVGVTQYLTPYVNLENREMTINVIDKKGNMVKVRPIDLKDKWLAFEPPKSPVEAIRNDVIQKIPKKQADYYLESPNDMFSTASMLVPFISSNQAVRDMVATKILGQSLPLKYREKARIQNEMVPGKSIEEALGIEEAVFSPMEGKISNITKDFIHIESKGKVTKVPYYNNFPLNKSSLEHHEIRIKKGDTVKKDQLLADSIFTRDGELALGTNLRTAYVPYKGYSVSGDEYVYIKNNDYIKRIKIKDFIPEGNEELLTINNETKKPEWKKIQKFIVHKTDEPMLLIRTWTGNEFRVTKYHSLVTLNDDGNLKEIKPKDIEINKTFVPRIVGLDFDNDNDKIYLEHTQRKSGKEIIANFETGFFFGMYLAEGWIVANKAVHISVTDKKLEEYVIDIAKKHFVLGYSRLSDRAIGFYDAVIAKHIVKYYKKYAQNKIVPNYVFNLNKDFRRGIVAGYFAGDGTAAEKKNGSLDVSYSSASKKLRDTMAELMKTIELDVSLAKYKLSNSKYYDSYKGRIMNATLCNMPYFPHEYKYNHIEKYAKKDSNDTWDMDNVIPIPKNLKEEFKQLAQNLPRKGYEFRYKGYCSRRVFKSLHLSGWFKKVVESNVKWDRIKSIEEVDKEEWVYDFALEDNHNFMLANGILVHNSFEDGIVVSDDAARKLTSYHLYEKRLPKIDRTFLDREKFLAYYPGDMTEKNIAKLDREGVVKEGEIVDRGDVIIAGLKKKVLTPDEIALGKLSKGLLKDYARDVITWDKDARGVIKYVARKPKEVSVFVKTEEPARVGDKLCYAEGTEILTENGFKDFRDLKLVDKVATNNNGILEYQYPDAVMQFVHKGKMYSISNSAIDLCVNLKHKMYVRQRGHKNFGLIEAQKIIGKRVEYKKNAEWKGKDVKFYIVPALKTYRDQHNQDEKKIVMTIWVEFLGYFLSEGSTHKTKDNGNYQVFIAQSKKINKLKYQKIQKCLDELPFDYVALNDGFLIRSKQLYEELKVFGKAKDKYIPKETKQLNGKYLKILYDALILGDGHEGSCDLYFTTSEHLRNDFQELCLKLNWSANYSIKKQKSKKTEPIGNIENWNTCYTLIVNKKKKTPQVNHGHVHQQKIQKEEVIDYDGIIYACQVPNHIIYIRRNGKTVWSGNSDLYGNKTVITKVVPMNEMPQNKAKEPMEILYNPLGVPSRMNLGQMIETGLQKVLDKQGKEKIILKKFTEDNMQSLNKIMKNEGIAPKEKLYDPIEKRWLDYPVFTGKKNILKLEHKVNTKFSARGLGTSYDENLQPMTGGAEGAKALDLLTLYSMLSHGAKKNLQEMNTLKAENNPEVWRMIQMGYPAPTPKPTFAYQKFMALLKGMGVDVRRNDNQLQLMPFTDAMIKDVSKGEIMDPEALVKGKNLEPIKGGLVDPFITGGLRGENWSHISLAEELPNPVFEGAILNLTGLKPKEYREILEGKKEV